MKKLIFENILENAENDAIEFVEANGQNVTAHWPLTNPVFYDILIGNQGDFR